MAYQKGQFSAQELKDKFGLNDQGLAKSNAGSSSGVKGHKLLGYGYLTDDNVKRLLKDPELKATFHAKRAHSKDKNDFDSVNDLDSVLHYIAMDGEPPAPAPEPEPEEIPIVHSDRLKNALERVSRWEDPENPEYHNFSERIFETDNEQRTNNPETFDRSDEFRSERPEVEYDFIPEELNAEAKANNLLNDYKNNIARTFRTSRS